MAERIPTTASNGGTGTRVYDINGDVLEQHGWTDCPGCGQPICDALYHTAACREAHRAAQNAGAAPPYDRWSGRGPLYAEQHERGCGCAICDQEPAE